MKIMKKSNQSRSSRMKTLTKYDDSFGTIKSTISENVFDRIASLKAMADLLNGSGLSWKDIKFREFPGVGPARSGGKWLYLSRRQEPGSNNIFPQTGLGKLYIESFIFYTDNEKEVASIKIGPYFKVDFNATFGKTYEDWSNEFGNKFNINL